MTLMILEIVALIISEWIVVIFLYQKKEFSYQKVSGIVMKKDYVLLMVDKEDRKIIYENKILYLDDKKKPYELIKDRGKMLTTNHKNYYEIIVKVSFVNKYKANDSIQLVFPKKKYRRIEIFKIILGGG